MIASARPTGLERAGPPLRRSPRFLFYSHDGLGLGHVRRNLAVAGAVTALAPAASVLLAAGSPDVDRLGVPRNVDVLRLPALRKRGNDDYAARRLAVSPDAVRALRSALLAAAVGSFEPDVVLVDKHPLGAGGELRAALEAARAAGCRLTLGLRDILDEPAVVVDEWARSGVRERISALYDRVLVYGHPWVYDPVREYGLPASVGERTRFCGYVLGPNTQAREQETAIARTPGRPLVLATTGGGEDGFELLRTFIAAAADAGWAAVAVAGPECDERASERLRAQARRSGVGFRTFVPGLASAFAHADALVCMGGYNTLTEALASGIRTVCVPRVHPRREQLLRARAFARLGAVSLVEPERLSAAVLRTAVEAALASPRPRERGARCPIDLGGARRAAGHLLALARERTPATTERRHVHAAR